MRLQEFVSSSTAGFGIDRDGLREGIEEMFPPDGASRFDVGAQEPVVDDAIVAVGGRDAGQFEPLVPAVVRQVAALDSADPDAVQPNLSVLGVMNGLQIMGLDVPEAAVRTGTGWLAGMRTAGLEPEWMHWTRGLAALALGDLPTARTIAALPETGPVEAHPDVSPGFNIQAWQALLVAAVERALPWEQLRPRWEELIALTVDTFFQTHVLAQASVPWLGRVVGHGIAGVPVGEVADWIHDELRRLTAAPR
ncbi:hypothetical protein SAMN05444365_10636 [Micromonospora pattaloongensis]|uniref:Uncharacterized protein n=1 Tax=Micromonospora pattaloongensis TaxID=405436 RepID=A0A1H3QNW9_9ACTN|nr:hypothetical protein [Micromonospora pattaloongensis]SDZ15067.1 hypothetical protein SAMN05444365_10636 [Micromonospora pattaloongensis]